MTFYSKIRKSICIIKLLNLVNHLLFIIPSRRLEGQLPVRLNSTHSVKILHIIKDFNLNVKTLINFISEFIAAQGTAHQVRTKALENLNEQNL